MLIYLLRRSPSSYVAVFPDLFPPKVLPYVPAADLETAAGVLRPNWPYLLPSPHPVPPASPGYVRALLDPHAGFEIVATFDTSRPLLELGPAAPSELLGSAYQAILRLADPDQLYQWTRDDRAIGCDTCAELAGLVKSARAWLESGVWPGRGTLCDGWCKCALRPLR